MDTGQEHPVVEELEDNECFQWLRLLFAPTEVHECLQKLDWYYYQLSQIHAVTIFAISFHFLGVGEYSSKLGGTVNRQIEQHFKPFKWNGK